MNLVEALRTGRKLRRPIASHTGSNGDGWLDPRYVLSLLTETGVTNFSRFCISEKDILADDWEIRPTAAERLQKRIDAMRCETGVTPTVLDVSEEDLQEMEKEINDWRRAPFFSLSPTKLTSFMSGSGEVRLVKARK